MVVVDVNFAKRALAIAMRASGVGKLLQLLASTNATPPLLPVDVAVAVVVDVLLLFVAEVDVEVAVAVEDDAASNAMSDGSNCCSNTMVVSFCTVTTMLAEMLEDTNPQPTSLGSAFGSVSTIPAAAHCASMSAVDNSE